MELLSSLVEATSGTQSENIQREHVLYYVRREQSDAAEPRNRKAISSGQKGVHAYEAAPALSCRDRLQSTRLERVDGFVLNWFARLAVRSLDCLLLTQKHLDFQSQQSVSPRRASVSHD